MLEGFTTVSASSEHVEAMNWYKDIHLRTLKFLQESLLGQMWTSKQVTTCLIECREELKYSNLEALDCLIRANLVNIHQVICRH